MYVECIVVSDLFLRIDIDKDIIKNNYVTYPYCTKKAQRVGYFVLYQSFMFDQRSID